METAPGSRNPLRSFFTGRRLRDIREYLTGYLMIAPAVSLIFLFGIFPVGFALFVSLHKWRLKRGDYIGITNYADAIDTLIYVALFVIAVGALVAVWFLLRRAVRQTKGMGTRPWLLTIPGAIHAATVIALFRYVWVQLPEFLDIADKLRTLERTREVFSQLLSEAFNAPSVQPAWQTFAFLALGTIVVGVIASFAWRRPENLTYQATFALVWLTLAIGLGLLYYTFQQINLVYAAAVESGTDPGIWPQLIMILSGTILLVIAWLIWRRAPDEDTPLRFWLRIGATFTLLLGGWLLAGEIPVIVASGNQDLWNGLKVTVFYSLGTVPFQLTIAMALSLLLFQRLRGSELFRILFFIPYVTPTVASAAIYRQLFSNRVQAPANQLLTLLGLEPQKWLREPTGIFAMLASHLGVTLPDWAAGPSQALVVIMIFSIWTFVGYNTVIYLAGLGNIPKELVEAAEIDGASKWQVFKNIIFPLLSPTTYFLTLIAIIGTFKAFNHIWVLRESLALGTTNTFSVAIFLEFFEKLRYGYASAMAFVLFAIILILTFVNNRIQGSRVFYG